MRGGLGGGDGDVRTSRTRGWTGQWDLQRPKGCLAAPPLPELGAGSPETRRTKHQDLRFSDLGIPGTRGLGLSSPPPSGGTPGSIPPWLFWGRCRKPELRRSPNFRTFVLPRGGFPAGPGSAGRRKPGRTSHRGSGKCPTRGLPAQPGTRPSPGGPRASLLCGCTSTLLPAPQGFRFLFSGAAHCPPTAGKQRRCHGAGLRFRADGAARPLLHFFPPRRTTPLSVWGGRECLFGRQPRSLPLCEWCAPPHRLRRADATTAREGALRQRADGRSRGFSRAGAFDT